MQCAGSTSNELQLWQTNMLYVSWHCDLGHRADLLGSRAPAEWQLMENDSCPFFWSLPGTGSIIGAGDPSGWHLQMYSAPIHMGMARLWSLKKYLTKILEYSGSWVLFLINRNWVMLISQTVIYNIFFLKSLWNYCKKLLPEEILDLYSSQEDICNVQL